MYNWHSFYLSASFTIDSIPKKPKTSIYATKKSHIYKNGGTAVSHRRSFASRTSHHRLIYTATVQRKIR